MHRKFLNHLGWSIGMRQAIQILLAFVAVAYFPINSFALSLPTEDEVRGIQTLCGAGSIQSISAKGNVDAAIKNWRNASAGANIEVAKKNLAGFLGSIKTDASLAPVMTVYIKCVQDTLQKFIDQEAKKPQKISASGASESLLRSRYATDSEMRKEGCAQARASALESLSTDCPGKILVLNEDCQQQSSGSPRSYISNLYAECRPT
jgi:hypothetical protein